MAMGGGMFDFTDFSKRNKEQGLSDLISIKELTHKSILDNLKKRMMADLVYTYVGDVLISVNPFKQTGIYNADLKKMYVGKALGRMPPHAYAIADASYRRMLRTEHSQSVLISGESGAGKTETTKVILSYLADISNMNAKNTKGTGDVAKRLMDTNPVLESFGNAKTLRNNNSSRFGKHFDIQFDDSGAILGAYTATYLLEKVRVTAPMKDERTYHILYQLCNAPVPLREELGIDSTSDFDLLTQSGCERIRGMNDKEEFQQTKAAMQSIGVRRDQQMTAWRMLAAVLHMGNVKFGENPKGGSVIYNQDVIVRAGDLLMVPPELLKEAVLTRTLGGGRISTYKVPLEPKQASSARDSLCKHLYGILFDWLVKCMNEYISMPSSHANIGVLDIFGFESFQSNSFEQLCINYCNESLHNLFIEHVFKLEQQVYMEEDISWNFVDYEDNQACLDLIEKRPTCLFAIMDEQCTSGVGSDAGMIQQLHSAFAGRKPNKYYEKPKKQDDKNFVVVHFAGPVTYTGTGFLDKNKDELNQDIIVLFAVHTTDKTLREMQKDDDERKAQVEEAAPTAKKRGGQKKSKKTIGKQFMESLQALMTKLKATEHHYIRCIKPNPEKKPHLIDEPTALAQLKCSGVLETCEIRKAGLNVRQQLGSFLHYYKPCHPRPREVLTGENRSSCQQLLDTLTWPTDAELPTEYKGRFTEKEGALVLGKDDFRVGKTLVFLREYSVLDNLDAIRETKILEFVLRLQSWFRGNPLLRWYRRVRQFIINMQKDFRSRRILRAFRELRYACITIQRIVRSRRAHQALLDMMKSEEWDTMEKAEKRNMLKKFLNPHEGLGESEEEDKKPEFQIQREGWVRKKNRTGLRGWADRYCRVSQGVLIYFMDEGGTDFKNSFELKDCEVEGEEPSASGEEYTFSVNIVHKDESESHIKRAFSLNEMKRRFFARTGYKFSCIHRGGASWISTLRDAIKEAKVIHQWELDKAKEEQRKEGKLAYNDVEVLKKGWLMKRKAGTGWKKRYFVLRSDGTLSYYLDMSMEVCRASVDLHYYAIDEVREGPDDALLDLNGEERGSMDVGAFESKGRFYHVEMGKKIELTSGRNQYILASPNSKDINSWIETLNHQIELFYTTTKLFSAQRTRVHIPDGTWATVNIQPALSAADAVKMVCTKFKVNNWREFGIVETWSTPAIEGFYSSYLLDDEETLNSRLKTWEREARRLHGFASNIPDQAFTFRLRKISTLKRPSDADYNEQHLEFHQAREEFIASQDDYDDSTKAELGALMLYKELNGKPVTDKMLITMIELYYPFPQDFHYRKGFVQSQMKSKASKLVLKQYEDLKGKCHSQEEARMRFLDQMAKIGQYGKGLFNVEMFVSARMLKKVVLAVSREGVKVLLAPLGKEVLHDYGWDRLVTWAGSEDVLILNVLAGNQLLHRDKVKFLTKQGKKIADLLTGYTKVLQQEGYKIE